MKSSTIIIEKALATAQATYKTWKFTSLKERLQIIERIKNYLLETKTESARTITKEMNKPISESLAEVEKCAYLCDYYIEHSEEFLKNQKLHSKWQESYLTFEPLGVILGIMPWNYPFWQVFRFVIPNIILGNTVVVKHASNVFECAEKLENIFNCTSVELYKNLPLESKFIADVITDHRIKAVSLTGSDAAGRSVASIAGKHLKKCVLELGGSNAFIVLDDADLEKTLDIALKARMQNAGQSCIAAKRFLVHESLYEKFIEGFKTRMLQLKTGDKYDENTQLGAMAREDLAEELHRQIEKSIALGANKFSVGDRQNAFYPATLLTNISTEMPVFKEETFGPVAVVLPFKSINQAISLSNKSNFGLGVSIFTKDIDRAKKIACQFEEGAVYINEMLISDPAIAFGGVKQSGYGKELSFLAFYEFANIKSVVVK